MRKGGEERKERERERERDRERERLFRDCSLICAVRTRVGS
jgi:hypothetical protein